MIHVKIQSVAICWYLPPLNLESHGNDGSNTGGKAETSDLGSASSRGGGGGGGGLGVGAGVCSSDGVKSGRSSTMTIAVPVISMSLTSI